MAETSSPISGARVVEFDFATKTERVIELDALPEAIRAGRFVWADIDLSEPEPARSSLRAFSLFSDEIVEDALTREPATQSARYDGYLHFVVSGCRLVGRHFDLERVDCVLSDRFLFTLHRGSVVFLDALRKDYSQDFVSFARSPRSHSDAINTRACDKAPGCPRKSFSEASDVSIGNSLTD